MMLFRRAARLTVWRMTADGFGEPDANVKGVAITDLRVRFAIKRDLAKGPNTCEVVITNLSERTRQSIEKKPLRIKLDAGHDDELRHLFVGDLRFGSSTFESPDWNTILHVADGERAYKHARANKSYRKGTSVLTILKDAAAAMGLPLPVELESSKELQSQVAAGETLSGFARDELTRLLAPFGYRWSIQDHRLMILKDQVTTGVAPWLVSQETGMVGSPTYGSPDKSGKPPSLTVKMLLRPEIIPGGTVRVESGAIYGKLFKVESVGHTGDTHGDDWFTELELKEKKPQ